MDRLLSMRVFERVAQEGGFAAAARALDISAPVVTRLVADLEEHLGTRLLQRTTRRLALTDAGQAYLTRVRNILQDIDEAHAAARTHTQGLSGLLRVHAPPVLATYVLGPQLGAFRERYPDIRLEIEVESNSQPPFEDYDLTLVGNADTLEADVIARKVIESHAILVAAPAYVARRGLPAQPEDLARHDILKLRTPGTRTRIMRMWHEQRPNDPLAIDVQPVITANHTDTLLQAALDGAGITSVAADLVAPHLTRGELVRVLSPWTTGELTMYAVLPSRKFVPQRTRVFLDFLVERSNTQYEAAMAACGPCSE